MLYLLLLVQVASILAQNPQINTGKLFVLELTKSSFFSETDALPSDPVKYLASELHYPDTPKWLHFLQRDFSEDALLYGSPGNSDTSISLEVVAVNQRSFQTAYKIFNITVLSESDHDHSDLYIVELWIHNFDIEEILKDRHLSLLMRRLKRIWGSPMPLQLVNVLPIPAVTGRRPVHDEPRQEIKEGVVIQIGAPVSFSSELITIVDQIQDKPCDKDTASKIDAKRKFSPEFDIDWCSLKLIEPYITPEPAPSGLLLANDVLPWSPRSASVKRQNLLLEFIITVIVPLCMAILLFIILSCVMFGRKYRRVKQEQWTTLTQLERYQTIKAAMTNLRYMSNYRDGPPPLSASTSPSPSSVNTLSRPKNSSQAPPPYRVPPSYSTSKSDEQNLDQPDNKEEGEATIDQSQLMTQMSPETLKVRK